jgi:mono/diheme cytochrome c family protein
MIEKYVNAEEFKKLLGVFSVILLVLAIAALFAIIVVPGLRNANKPSAEVISAIGETGWLDPAEYPPQRSRIIPPVDPQSLLQPSAELISRGKALFEQNCVQCHGAMGRGDGASAGTMTPPPRNFTVSSGWVNGFDLPGVYRTISKGIQNSSMASFDYLPRKERMALAHVVQSFGAFPHGSGNAEAVEALTKELASPGEKTPNKIPVSLAAAKLREEYRAPIPFIIKADDFTEEAQLFRHIIIDRKRAGQTLADSLVDRTNLKELANTLAANAPGNGFSPSIALLTPLEWRGFECALSKNDYLPRANEYSSQSADESKPRKAQWYR